ncbi:3-hydroxyacyl-CoA dehydrogenase family protein [Candidatus Bathyarchaeota archaeon]|nr:MAG: 3-hydroxyacyl-CoA dehydrogenase family protein [Candidatus Bathyarchaeota archaeon]
MMEMNIEKVACIGAGVIGHSWATLFAWKGYRVALQDVDEAALKYALARIRKNLEFLSEKELLRNEEAEEILQRIEVTTSLRECVEAADYIQESVPENYSIKKEVFRKADSFARSQTIIASSTSTLKMTEIQKATRNPERCVIAHPWNPPHLMPLVEIIPGEKTSRETVEVTRNFMEALGKVSVIQKKETVGSIGNRLAAALWREAINIVDEGIADLEDVDKAVSAGPGLRWAVIGPHLSYHLGGGRGGIEHFLDHLGPAMESRWRSLASWVTIPPSAKRRLVEGIRRHSMLRERSMEELIKWRDDRLVKLIKILYLEKE